MSGISSTIQSQATSVTLSIAIKGRHYSIDINQFECGASNDQMLAWTDRALAVFRDIESIIKKEQKLNLDPEFCHVQLVKLAECGSLAYRSFFSAEAREILASRFEFMGGATPAPTFISKEIPFPWETLYDGEDYEVGEAGMFWGMRCALARILDYRDFTKYAREQSLPSDMLFCLHHKLRQAHQQEWPEIEKLVRRTQQCRFDVFGVRDGQCSYLGQDWRNKLKGKELLKYLYQAEHNMVHFACHCRQGDAGDDVLQITLIDKGSVEEAGEGDAHVIGLETNTFVLAEGRFQRQPLVFLNACQTAGGADALRKDFNLPQKFIESGAAAVIATACSVPDLFAAAFARQFYHFFLHEQMTIGQALRATRWHFLEVHHNPLGLAYGLYSPAHYRVAQPPAAVGGFA